MPFYGALDGMYFIGETIGSGGFGKVKKGFHVSTGETVAIKIINKKRLGVEVSRVQIEIEALKQLKHQNICQLYQVIETEDNFFLVLEYCPNGELFDYIVTRDRLDEENARFFFCQIVSAVAYIHNQGYAHRDLKPENLLLDYKGNLKLIDFGLCVKPTWGLDTHISTCCGSPAYAAPELISGKSYLGREADIWSLGILLYAILCGFLPFDDSNTALLFQKIQIGKFVTPLWLSPESSDLIHKMLQTDPNIRIKMNGLIKHPWITNGSPVPLLWHSTRGDSHLDDECVRKLGQHYEMSAEEIVDLILKSDHDYLTATYKLLLQMKCNGKRIKLGLNKTPGIHSPFSKPQGNKKNKCPVTDNTPKNETNATVQNYNNYVHGSPRFEFENLREYVLTGRARINKDDRVSKISDEVLKNINSTSKHKANSQNVKKVKWNIPKMPKTNCMRGCNWGFDDDKPDCSFPNNIKCCIRGNHVLRGEENEFVFIDYRKRKLECGNCYSKDKKDAITKEFVTDPSVIYSLCLSPRTVQGRINRNVDICRACMNGSNKKENEPLPRKLTRWRNNQKRKAPDRRYLNPSYQGIINTSVRKSSSPESNGTDISKNLGEKHQPAVNPDKPCRRICEWLLTSSEATEDEDTVKTYKKIVLADNKCASPRPQFFFNSKESGDESEIANDVKATSLEMSTRNRVAMPPLTGTEKSQWKSIENCSNVAPHSNLEQAQRTSASVETNLNHQVIKNKKQNNKTTIIGSFEKGMDRLICMLTPKKKDNFRSDITEIKAGHNVILTDQHELGPALHKLKYTLEEKKIEYRENGFNLRCHTTDRFNNVILSFNLEVVQMDNNSIGIHHRRLTGDTWHYKRLCSNIFRKTNII